MLLPSPEVPSRPTLCCRPPVTGLHASLVISMAVIHYDEAERKREGGRKIKVTSKHNAFARGTSPRFDGYLLLPGVAAALSLAVLPDEITLMGPEVSLLVIVTW